MTGNRLAHPLLISLANLNLGFRMKSSNRGFLLLALLPIPNFLHPDKKIRPLLESRLFHECVEFVIRPLKIAASIGIMLEDALGHRRYCFTPLVSCIVDTPESALYAGVGGKTSSVTMAYNNKFGDNYRHEPRTASTTIAQLQAIEAKVDPWDLKAYLLEAKSFRLNGVHRPFWLDWPLAEPSRFLTPEPLHHFHKMFWDHDAKWCVRVVGSAEIDFRFSVLQPHVGFRHFKEGISKLKQVTGREHRDMQRYLIGIIAGAVPKDFLIAVRALMDFRYIAQACKIDESACGRLTDALKEFHDHKAAIIAAGGRVGKRGKIIDNWMIPKLEMLQSVVPNISANGVAIQWSADVTEHAHITEIKNPADSTNNQNYEPQICRYLDRLEKCRRFDVATSIRSRPSKLGVADSTARMEENSWKDSGSSTRHANPSDGFELLRPRTITNYFKIANLLEQGSDPEAQKPFRTFASGDTAFHLTRKPSFKQLEVDVVAANYGLLDLRPALSDYLQHASTGGPNNLGGRRKALPGCPLPFRKLQVWSRFRIQSKAFHNHNEVLEARTVNASPPNHENPFGLCDSVLIATHSATKWPESGLHGESSCLLSEVS